MLSLLTTMVLIASVIAFTPVPIVLAAMIVLALSVVLYTLCRVASLAAYAPLSAVLRLEVISSPLALKSTTRRPR